MNNPKANKGSGAKVQNVSWHQFSIQYFVSHAIACKISFRNLALTPIATLMTMIAIGVCLSLPMGLFLFVKNIQHLSQGWDKASSLTLYTTPKLTPPQLNAITAKIKEYPGVEKITHIPQNKALQEFQQMSGMQDILNLLPENPLPDVIHVKLNTDMSTQELLTMKEALSHVTNVNKISYDQEWVEKLNAFLSFGKTLTEFLYIIIGLGVVLIIGNTIRLALERHRDEIEVLNLIGATTAYIRRPFLYRGALYGTLGGLIAALILNIIILALERDANHLASLYQGVFALESLKFKETLLLLIGSGLLGWMGAGFAFSQQEKSILASEA